MKHKFKVGDRVRYIHDISDKGTIIQLYGINRGKIPDYDVSWDSGLYHICHPEDELISDFFISQHEEFSAKIKDRLG